MSTITTGAVDALDAALRRRLFDRAAANAADVSSAVTGIIDDVRTRGDAALVEMAARFDDVALQCLEVPRREWDTALAAIDPAVRAAMEQAASSILAFHAAQLPADFEVEVRPGVRLGRVAEPLDSVGVYAPGGRAAYPSSVLMGVVPAKVAGVRTVIVCSPPGPDGRPSPVVLAACAIAGADRVFSIGGAGAVAALALGTASVPAVARVIGPGNAFVAEAKRQLTGIVAIDSPAGPSEVLVIADDSADAELIAAELLAQAEHDPDAAAVAVIIASPPLRDAVLRELERRAPLEPRGTIITEALHARGAVLDAATLEDALAFAEHYAPEHLSLMIESPREALPRVRCAGTVFLGAATSVAFGDYMTGANHVLPTNRLTRSYSGLSILDFVRFATYQEVSPAAAASLAPPTAVFAIAENLPAHARAARLRASPPGLTSPSVATAVAPVRFRDAYRDIEPYEPGRVPCDVDLSDNTNLWGIPPAAAALLADAEPSRITRYPTVYARELKAALAARHGATPANITTGCGSDDVLDSLMRAFCRPGEAVAFPSPTFGVVDLFARMNAAEPVAVGHRDDGSLDVAGLAAAGAAVTYVCSPNNPTGTPYDRSDVETLARSVRGILVIDEAYADYARIDAVDLALGSDRVVVVRTFSKAFGLAGLRVGYAIGSSALIREIEKSRGPYKVGNLAEAAAIAALGETAWVESRIAEVRVNRERVRSALAGMGLPPLPSAANFLLIPVPQPHRASAWGEALRTNGVAVRAFDALPGIGDAIRVTIGPWPLMERFMNALGTLKADERIGN